MGSDFKFRIVECRIDAEDGSSQSCVDRPVRSDGCSHATLDETNGSNPEARIEFDGIDGLRLAGPMRAA
jgi:hypothetical protein